MNLQPAWIEYTHTHTDKYKHILKNTLVCLLGWSIWLAYWLIQFNVMHMVSRQTGNCGTELRRFYYTWLHCLNNSYINSELDLCRRECQCDTKCWIWFIWKITWYPLHINSVTSIQVRGKPWHMHGSSALSLCVEKQFLSCSCRSSDTHWHTHTHTHTHTYTHRHTQSIPPPLEFQRYPYHLHNMEFYLIAL